MEYFKERGVTMAFDEEKKAIEYLKIEYEKLMKEDNILFPLYKSDAKRLIDIIEKQSKEIEELESELQHKNDQLFLGDTQWGKYIDKNYIPKSKIKEKIEELNKLITEAQKELGSASKEYTIYVYQKDILQELLEKRK